MPTANPIQTTFNAGEWSTRMEGRTDLAKYRNACIRLENMLPMPQGGATKRPGTYYVTTTKSSGQAILIPFQFSTTQAYVIEMGEHYMRFYKDDGQIAVAYAAWGTGTAYVIGNLVTQGTGYYRCLIAHTSGVFADDLAAAKWVVSGGVADLAYEIVTTYDDHELFDIQFAQSADTLYIAHQSHAPAKLTRTAHTTWTLSTISFTATPFATDFPAAVAFFEERLCWGGTPLYPQSVWASVSGSYEDLTIHTDDDDALKYTILGKQVNAIRWMADQDFLMIGTVGGVWRLGGSTVSDPLTPTSVNAKRQVTFGSNTSTGLLVGDAILYAQGVGKKFRELVYNYQKDGWIGNDLTITADHITSDGIIQFDVQTEPDSVVWAVTDDGKLISLTYERAHEVIGWANHILGGNYGGDAAVIESVAVIPNTTSGEDEVWLIVKRTIDSSTVRCIEYMKPRDFGVKEDAFFVDCGLTWDGGDAVTITDVSLTDPVVITYDGDDPTDGWTVYIEDVVGTDEVNELVFTVASTNAGANTFELSGVDGTAYTTYVSGGTWKRVAKSFSGLTHLEGEEVAICGDGAAVSSETVASGAVATDDYYNKVHIGLAYTPYLQPMKIDAGAIFGTAQGTIKRVDGVTIRFKDTIGCQIGKDEDNLEDIDFGVNADLYTGDKFTEFKGEYDTNGDILISQDVPLPLTVLALMPTIWNFERGSTR